MEEPNFNDTLADLKRRHAEFERRLAGAAAEGDMLGLLAELQRYGMELPERFTAIAKEVAKLHERGAALSADERLRYRHLWDELREWLRTYLEERESPKVSPENEEKGA